MSSRKRKVYAIARGREGFQGIVDTWAQCSSIVQGVYGAKFKSFTDPEEAAKFAYGVDSPERKNQSEKKRRVDPPATVDLSQDDSEVGFEVVHTDGACENNGKATAIAGVSFSQVMCLMLGDRLVSTLGIKIFEMSVLLYRVLCRPIKGLK